MIPRAAENAVAGHMQSVRL